ncbi:DUF4384 domain-containing protein [bacterium]|nr:DUF4384 domain-containing protein [bacterium]
MKTWLLAFLFVCQWSVAQEKDWAKKNKSDKFPDAKYLQAVGAGSTIDEAKNQAFLNIAKIIEVKITGEQTYSSTEKISGKSGESSSTVVEESKAAVNLDLQGLRIEDTDYNKKNKTYYALAVLDRQVAGQALRAEITDKNARYKNFLEQGKVLFKNKSYYEAIEKMQICISELERMDRQLKKLRIIQPDETFEAGISKISEESEISGIIDAIGKDEANSNLDITVALLVYKLYRSFGDHAANTSVVFGNFNYQNTKMSSAFTAYLKEKIEVELAKIGQAKVIGSKKVSQYLQSHGIQFDGTAEGLASISGADATIIGSYWELDDKIEIRTQIVTRVTGENIGSANLTFPEKSIPKSISYRPENFSQIQSDLELLKDDKRNSNLKLVIWTDRGDGGVYKENEKLLIYLKSNQDCYVKVIYHDAGGNNIQIFPNTLSDKSFKMRADNVYTLGGSDTPFEFTVAEPFGTELIKAFASTEPFPELDKQSVQQIGNGMYLLKKDTKSLVENFKAVAMGKKDTGYAEASVSLTTVKSLK